MLLKDLIVLIGNRPLLSRRNSKFILSFIIISLACLTCSKRKYEPKETILARVGEKTISVDEFIRRAEYTIRPSYCKLDYNVHKKIVLNSLIAEKMFALETKEDNELLNNDYFNRYIKGRKEQAMRKWLFYQEAYNKASIDTTEIQKIYKISGREYKIEYYTFEDSTSIQLAEQKFKKKESSFETFFHQIGGMGEIPKRKVKWDSQEPEIVHDSLFSKPLKRGQVIGPFKFEDDQHIIIRIAGWTDHRVMTNDAIQQRWRDVEEELKRRKAGKIWKAHVANIMKGKKVKFVHDTFWRLNELFFTFHYKTVEEIKDAFTKKMWENEDVELSFDYLDDLENILDQPFFQVDGNVWTVRDFKNALYSHPLVYRKRKMSKREFPNQFKLAVVDLIRDHYVTQEAVKKSADKVNFVHRETGMWKDALLASYNRNKYLESIGERENFAKSYIRIMNQYLNAVVDSLQQKYSNQIEINIDAFENIQLTRIDLFVTEKEMPYQVVVPSFPMYTTDYKLDYGKRMN